MISPELDRPEAGLTVSLFGRVRCVFCNRRVDRLIVHPRGVRTVHPQRTWPPGDYPNPQTTGPAR